MRGIQFSRRGGKARASVARIVSFLALMKAVCQSLSVIACSIAGERLVSACVVGEDAGQLAAHILPRVDVHARGMRDHPRRRPRWHRICVASRFANLLDRVVNFVVVARGKMPPSPLPRHVGRQRPPDPAINDIAELFAREHGRFDGSGVECEAAQVHVRVPGGQNRLGDFTKDLVEHVGAERFDEVQHVAGDWRARRQDRGAAFKPRLVAEAASFLLVPSG